MTAKDREGATRTTYRTLQRPVFSQQHEYTWVRQDSLLARVAAIMVATVFRERGDARQSPEVGGLSDNRTSPGTPVTYFLAPGGEPSVRATARLLVR